MSLFSSCAWLPFFASSLAFARFNILWGLWLFRGPFENYTCDEYEKRNTEEILNFIKGDEVDEEGKKIAIDFNKIIPMPKYIFKGSLGNEELKKYGKNNWYDWSIQNRGCKWNASRSNVG